MCETVAVVSNPKTEGFYLGVLTVKEAESLRDALEKCFKNETMFLKKEIKSLEKIYDTLMSLDR